MLNHTEKHTLVRGQDAEEVKPAAETLPKDGPGDPQLPLGRWHPSGRSRARSLNDRGCSDEVPVQFKERGIPLASCSPFGHIAMAESGHCSLLSMSKHHRPAPAT